MTKSPRPTQPHVWTSLALASVTLAASPVMAGLQPAPITLAIPQARIWLAQAEGGEAGEAGITKAAPEDTAYLTELMIIHGHMQAARDLYAMGQKDIAVELSKHPQEEGALAALQAEIAKHQAQDVADEIAAFTDTMAKGAPQDAVDQAAAQVAQAFAAAASVKDTEIRARFDAVVPLVKAASGEYQASITDGKVEDLMGWHEAWSFIGLAPAIKLAAGEVILYPSTTLHRVEPVTSGTRLAVVGWVQSLIRDQGQREILFDLDQAVEACFAAEGKSPQFDRLSKTRSNLLRMWVDA